MKRVLIVAYYFPPLGGIGSIRLSRFAHHLPEFGWEPVVLAPYGTPHPIDPDLAYDASRVIRARSIELSRIGRARGHSGSRAPAPAASSPPRSSGAAMGSARRLAKQLVFPDAQVGWWPGAVMAGRRTLRREHFDAVFSSSFPITAHLVANDLSNRAKLPWLAEFRDPWSERLPRIPYQRAARTLERRIASRAERTVMPTPTWARHFGSLWGTDVAVLPNGHEMSPASGPPSTPATLAHIGSHYVEHYSDLRMLWKALEALGRGGEPTPRVQWVGSVSSEIEAELSRLDVPSVEITGPVSHRAAVELTKGASMLFACGPRGIDPISRGWVPAKLFEYVASGRSVLLIGDPAGDAAALLRSVPGCFVCRPDDLEGIMQALREGLATSSHERDSDGFSRRARARELARLLDRLEGIRG